MATLDISNRLTTSQPSNRSRVNDNNHGNHRGGRQHGGRGRSGRRGPFCGENTTLRNSRAHGHDNQKASVEELAAAASTTPFQENETTLPLVKTEVTSGPGDAEAEVCFICANSISYHAYAPCNHLTCHICALRLRALYQKKECPHCRTASPYVIFSTDADRRFEEHTPADISTTDDNIGIMYTSERIVADTVLLLRYNCPDASCDYAGRGWPDLHAHVRSVHHKKMCDLCTRNKKVFTHEHDLFTGKELERHMRYGDHRPGQAQQTGFIGHPLCTLCGNRFYDEDQLKEHRRERHEACFLCDRRDPTRPHFYQDYEALEQHFRIDHYLCPNWECREKKFVVFASEIDFKAHQLSEHGNSLAKEARRDARVVDLSSFDIRQPYQQQQHQQGRRRGDGGSSPGRGFVSPDYNWDPLPVSSAQPLRRDELAYQRQLAVQSAQSVLTRTFGGHLTTNTSSLRSDTRAGWTPAPSGQRQALQPQAASRPSISDEMDHLTVDLLSLTPAERDRAQRHTAVIERAAGILGNDEKIAAFRAHISSFSQGRFTGAQLLEAFSALFTQSSSRLGTLVREVSELFDDPAKSEALRKAWQDWRAANDNYPTLPGLGELRTPLPASPGGWAQAQDSNHPKKLKNKSRQSSAVGNATISSVASGSGSGSSSRAASTPQRPSANSAFPALPSAVGSSRVAVTSSTWVSGGASSATAASGRTSNTQASVTPANAKPTAAARANAGPSRSEAFPSLPAAPKPLTTIMDYGSGVPRRNWPGPATTNFSWDGNHSAAEPSTEPTMAGETADGEGHGGGKGKKKKKQVLMAWG